MASPQPLTIRYNQTASAAYVVFGAPLLPCQAPANPLCVIIRADLNDFDAINIWYSYAVDVIAFSWHRNVAAYNGFAFIARKTLSFVEIRIQTALSSSWLWGHEYWRGDGIWALLVNMSSIWASFVYALLEAQIWPFYWASGIFIHCELIGSVVLHQIPATGMSCALYGRC